MAFNKKALQYFAAAPKISAVLLPLIGITTIAALTGLLSALLPWWFMIVLTIIPAFAIAAWLLPEFAAVFLLATLFGVFPDALLPTIPIGGGELKPEDLGVPVLFAMLLIKQYGSIKLLLTPIRPYLVPLGAFILSAVISVVIAYLYKTAPVKDIFNEVRPYFTWLFLPVFCLAVDSDNRMRRFKFLLIGLALILAVGVTIQSLTGYAIFGRGQELRQLWSTDGGVAGVLRSTTPGMFLMTGALIYLLAAYAKEQIHKPILLGVLVAVLCAGTLVGFGRGMWLSIVVGIILLAFFSRKTAYIRLAVACGVIGATLFVSLIAIKPDYVMAIADRFLSVGTELESGTSFGRRKEENYYALQKIAASPLLGVGLGGRYKPDNAESRAWPEQARYIHNAYLKVAVKTGLPGLLAVVFMIGFMLKRTWSAARGQHKDPALAFATMWVILTTTIFTAITQPNFIASNGIASIALAIFLSEALRLADNRNANPNSANRVPQSSQT